MLLSSHITFAPVFPYCKLWHPWTLLWYSCKHYYPTMVNSLKCNLTLAAYLCYSSWSVISLEGKAEENIYQTYITNHFYSTFHTDMRCKSESTCHLQMKNSGSYGFCARKISKICVNVFCSIFTEWVSSFLIHRTGFVLLQWRVWEDVTPVFVGKKINLQVCKSENIVLSDFKQPDRRVYIKSLQLKGTLCHIVCRWSFVICFRSS